MPIRIDDFQCTLAVFLYVHLKYYTLFVLNFLLVIEKIQLSRFLAIGFTPSNQIKRSTMYHRICFYQVFAIFLYYISSNILAHED